MRQLDRAIGDELALSLDTTAGKCTNTAVLSFIAKTPVYARVHVAAKFEVGLWRLDEKIGSPQFVFLLTPTLF